VETRVIFWLNFSNESTRIPAHIASHRLRLFVENFDVDATSCELLQTIVHYRFREFAAGNVIIDLNNSRAHAGARNHELLTAVYRCSGNVVSATGCWETEL